MQFFSFFTEMTEQHDAFVAIQIIVTQSIHAALCVTALGSREMGEAGEDDICGPCWKHQVLFYIAVTQH